MAYSEDFDAIYVEPPEATVLTDEDSGDEDSGGTIDNLSGRQLRAQAEVRFVNKENMTAEPDLPTSSKLASTSSHHKVLRKSIAGLAVIFKKKIILRIDIRVLHGADNSKPNLEDKVWKLRPFINKLKSKYVEHYQPEKHMSYDESMIKYYGRHPCKQFIRGKPIRFGYKMWALNTTSGYSVDCELYQGKNSQRSEIYEKEFGKAAAPFVTKRHERQTL
ncbi:hypothetical protein JTB14_036437 [Gonioctena quinquepunctata]|nr:hypothetical protein JTB14_036437 [Gonioctena quinquepunctata]